MSTTPQPPTPTPSDPASLTEQRQAFGAQVRRLRTQQGLSIDSLAQTTRISVAFLQALEAGDFAKLPGQVFVKGFVRSITKALGCPEGELIAAFDGLLNQVKPTSVLKVEIKNKPVRQRSDRVAKFVHNSQSLLRRGVLVQVAMPGAVVLVAIYWFATSAVLHRMAGQLRDHANNLVVTPAKSLQLKEVNGDTGAPAGAAVPDNVAPPTAEAILGAAPAAAASSDAAGLEEVAAEPSAAAQPQADMTGESKTEAKAETPEVAKAPVAVPAPAPTTTSIKIPATGDEQVLELTVVSPVKMRLEVDKGRGIVKELKPDTYRFTFTQKADMMIYDAAAVKISFNGKPLGPLGTKGRVRRLSFQAQTPSAKKM